MSLPDPSTDPVTAGVHAPGPESRPGGHADEGRVPCHPPGTYLTNEVFLYCVVGAAGEGDDWVELEDCYGLDVVRVPVGDSRTRRLRVVTPARASAIEEAQYATRDDDLEA